MQEGICETTIVLRVANIDGSDARARSCPRGNPGLLRQRSRLGPVWVNRPTVSAKQLALEFLLITLLAKYKGSVYGIGQREMEYE